MLHQFPPRISTRPPRRKRQHHGGADNKQEEGKNQVGGRPPIRLHPPFAGKPAGAVRTHQFVRMAQRPIKRPVCPGIVHQNHACDGQSAEYIERLQPPWTRDRGCELTERCCPGVSRSRHGITCRAAGSGPDVCEPLINPGVPNPLAEVSVIFFLSRWKVKNQACMYPQKSRESAAGSTIKQTAQGKLEGQEPGLNCCKRNDLYSRLQLSRIRVTFVPFIRFPEQKYRRRIEAASQCDDYHCCGEICQLRN